MMRGIACDSLLGLLSLSIGACMAWADHPWVTLVNGTLGGAALLGALVDYRESRKLAITAKFSR